MELILPEARRVLYAQPGSNNRVVQLVRKPIKVFVTDPVKTDFGLKVTIEEKTVYITSKGKSPDPLVPTLQSKKTPTVTSFQNGVLELKKWLNLVDASPSEPSEITKSWRGKFHFAEENLDEGRPGLRQPQICSLHMILGHLIAPKKSGIVVLPTGTGKTETMLSALVALPCKKLLVIVPSDPLRNQIAEKFISLGLLKSFGIVDKDLFYPTVGKITSGFNGVNDLGDFVGKSNVIVSTMDVLDGFSDAQLQLLKDNISQVFIDEAHHTKADTWDKTKNVFGQEKIVQFTATPFRNDRKRLDGKFLYEFSLREAQLQGYYKKIKFLPVSVNKLDQADKAIAKLAIETLRSDLAAGYNHILMARCATKERARKIFELYKNETDLNPVTIYSGIKDKKLIYEDIINKKTRIIVCVDMLGEGFDLPELKIAAFHDIRKSLPITLQFAGRFTRSKFDEELGDASFIANIADPGVQEELDDLYARNADWNRLLSDLGNARVQEEVDFKAMIEGFSNFENADIPYSNIKVKLSTVVFKNPTDTWNPKNFVSGLKDYETAFYKNFDINSEAKILLIINAFQNGVDWVDSDNIYKLNWRIIVVFWETKNNLLFIHSSDNSSLYKSLAEAVLDGEPKLISGVDVFKAFDDLDRISLQNVGLRDHLGKDIRFRMMVGRSLEEAISVLEQQKGEKAFVMGRGYRFGKKVTLGASYKGRIWSIRENDLNVFSKWCKHLGDKLIDPNIDPNQFLLSTLVPVQCYEFPDMDAVWIDWDEVMYDESETHFKFVLGTERYDLSSVNINIEDKISSKEIQFSISGDGNSALFKIILFENARGDDKFPDFKIESADGKLTSIIVGSRTLDVAAFLQDHPPTIWFVDGSSMTGTDYIKLKQDIGLYSQSKIEAWDWTGVNIAQESQDVAPITTSIQYNVVRKLALESHEIVFDDDAKGEAADIIAVSQFSDKIVISLYHLKYAHKGLVSNNIKNLYEVCGQAQRSMHWKHKSGDEIFRHMLRREPKTLNGVSRTRIEKGTLERIEELKRLGKRSLPIEYQIIIIQPSVSKASASPEILKLLGVTENFIKEFAGASLRFIGSA